MALPGDTPRHQGSRRKLVAELKEKGIADAAVLEAIGRVPRHLFLNSAFDTHAYDDRPFSIGAGQTISQPFTVAVQSELLKIQKGMKVLEVGTGSGFQAAVLYEMGAKVFSVERIKELYDRTRMLLKSLGYNVKTFFGDGNVGVPSYAPYDRIIITAGAPIVPEGLLGQLKEGGIMVIPLSVGDVEIMKTITKLPDGKLDVKEHGTFRFVPMLEDKG
ncbi:MAG: protein-L-isoaspartate(D-aspartate) O-methyltransferase [Flavobacteriales bacterium]|nr:protein-L-isoaspartate(D-aspartate) O-methyltransferase [Flavobacteriales bacterium]